MGEMLQNIYIYVGGFAHRGFGRSSEFSRVEPGITPGEERLEGCVGLHVTDARQSACEYAQSPRKRTGPAI